MIARRLASVEGDGGAPSRQRRVKVAIFLIRLAPYAAGATGICRLPGLGERQPRTSKLRRIMLRSIDHFIGGSSFASGEGPEGRSAEVFDPNQGQVQAQVRLGTAADLQKAVD